MTVAGPDMQAKAGHLVSGEASATLELIITAYPSKFAKSHKDEVGLNTWDF